ncbi:hypothetical protein M899_0951 [Bacteriovorax sp. BSW11_IV]|uniref:hypothetical protein n=1 Tax=Bacteriovorax sp. BSW11_IV TaxID=1353529 RepID=UPI00038A252D|nr:hypothetical protein [Bacteriovorax sp. BSW11_IV]EQC48617.1 hypothetical protein M899_0951 [Bacteriovorax sp. BSW11_IV]
MNIAFVILARTPGLKPIRNRLSRTTSKDFAEDFYLHSLEATADMAKEIARVNPDFKIYFALEEKEGLKASYWQGQEVLLQGDGGLGDKLDRLYKKLLKDHDAVFFMMPNTAQMAPNVLEFDLLNFLTSDYDYLLGKTDKGDFYLFGGSKPVSFTTWIDVPYNCAITFDELDRALSKSGTVLHISESFGILEKSDLQNFNHISSEELLDSQLKLRDLALNTTFQDRFM